MLPQNFGQTAQNTKLWSSELRPFYDDTLEVEVQPNTQSIYKYRRTNGTFTWLSWTTDVDVVKDPVYNDEYNRIIISGIPGGLRVTDTSIVGSDTTITINNSYTLAIPSVEDKVLMTVVKGNTEENLESRTYAFALVREWEDGKLDIGPLIANAEDANGVPYVDVYTSDNVQLTNIKISDAAYSGSRVRYIYIYRSVVSSTGITGFAFVDSIPVVAGQTTYSYLDDTPESELGELAVSTTWDAPLDILTGIVSLNNGVLAAFTGHDVYFSYPYQSSAWPQTQRITVDYPIVGLGAFGNQLVVCTESVPSLVSVADPAAAYVQPIQENIPCLSKRSIVSSAYGVLYATKNGLALISSSQPSIITDAIYTRDEWRLLGPHTFRAALYDSTYYAGFDPETGESGVFIFDLESPESGAVILTPKALELYSDIEDSDLYMVRPIYNADVWGIVKFDSDYNARRVFTWKSKIDTSTEGLFTFAAARVIFGFNDERIGWSGSGWRGVGVGGDNGDGTYNIGPGLLTPNKPGVIDDPNYVMSGINELACHPYDVTSLVENGYWGIPMNPWDSFKYIHRDISHELRIGPNPDISVYHNPYDFIPLPDVQSMSEVDVSLYMRSTKPVEDDEPIDWERQPYAILRFFVDEQLRFEKKVYNSRPFRLPHGFRGHEIEVEVETNCHIHDIELATSIGELK